MQHVWILFQISIYITPSKNQVGTAPILLPHMTLHATCMFFYFRLLHITRGKKNQGDIGTVSDFLPNVTLYGACMSSYFRLL
jgi:hypothetical protein